MAFALGQAQAALTCPGGTFPIHKTHLLSLLRLPPDPGPYAAPPGEDLLQLAPTGLRHKPRLRRAVWGGDIVGNQNCGKYQGGFTRLAVQPAQPAL